MCGIYGSTKSGGNFFSYLYRLLKRSHCSLRYTTFPWSVIYSSLAYGGSNLVAKRKMVEWVEMHLMGGCGMAHKSMRTQTSFRPGCLSLSVSQVANISPRGTSADIPARFATSKPLVLDRNRVPHCETHKNCRCLPCELYSSAKINNTQWK